MNLRDDLEIVNAIYGEDTGVYNEKIGEVTLKTCINIDQDVVLSNGEQSTTIRVDQLPPITAYLTVDGASLTLTKFDSVASKTAISETLEEVIKEPTVQEDEEGILMRIMNTLHTLPLQELLVESPETLNDVVTKLMEHNMRHTREEFEQMSHDCQICLSRRKGLHCVQMECGCVFCTTCLRNLLKLHISEGSIEAIRCPTSDCSQRISDSTIGAVVGEQILNRYIYLREKHAAEQDPRTVHCPLCQTPVKRPAEHQGESDEGAQRLRVCPECTFTFCCYCRKTYHGPVTACPTSTTHQFVRAYAQAAENSSEKLALERKYGRKYLQRLLSEFVEAESNRRIIESTSQACPNCFVRTEKISGCNHMSCRCNFHFCYLCGSKLNPQNPYQHFNTPGTHCFQRLFDGVLQTNRQEEDNEDEIVFVDRPDDDEGLEIQLALMQIAEEHM